MRTLSIKRKVMATKKMTTKKKPKDKMRIKIISLTKKKKRYRRWLAMILARSRPHMKPWRMMLAQRETRQCKSSKKLRPTLMRLSLRFQARSQEKSPSAILYINCSRDSRRTQKWVTEPKRLLLIKTMVMKLTLLVWPKMAQLIRMRVSSSRKLEYTRCWCKSQMV